MFLESRDSHVAMIAVISDKHIDGSVFDYVEAVTVVTLLDDDGVGIKFLDLRSFDKVRDECTVHVMEEIFVKCMKQVSAIHRGRDLIPGIFPWRGGCWIHARKELGISFDVEDDDSPFTYEI